MQQPTNSPGHSNVYATPHLPAFHAEWVTDRILAGRNPLTADDIQTLVAQNITHILDLREPHEWTAPRYGEEALIAIERCGLLRLNLKVRDAQEPTFADLDTACRFIEEALEEPNARVYVHCRAGIGRTAAILIAFYARHYDVSYDMALARLREGRSILTPVREQERVVRRWLAA